MTPASQENPRVENEPEGVPIPLQSGSPVNIALIVGSILLAIWTHLGQNVDQLMPWLISQFPAYSPECLLEVRSGQLWRLLSPAFLHFSIAHIGFNLLNLMMLGNILERRVRSGHYLWLTMSIALCSNVGEYFISGSQYFGGMSGVVYGLIGYVWIRGRRDPTFGLGLPNETLVMALVWFVLCLTGAIGAIANGAHAVGLVLGALWGFTDSQSAIARLRADPNFLRHRPD